MEWTPGSLNLMTLIHPMPRLLGKFGVRFLAFASNRVHLFVEAPVFVLAGGIVGVASSRFFTHTHMLLGAGAL